MDLKALKILPPWDWPEDAATLLIAVLSDKAQDESERMDAAAMAGEFTVADEAIAEVLLSIVADADEPEELRAQAAISLGPALEFVSDMEFEVDDDEEAVLTEETYRAVQTRLHQLYDTPGVPDVVRRAVLEGSVRGPQDWHAGAVRDAYASNDDAWRLTAVFCMQYVRGFDEAIVEALDSDEVAIVCEAVTAAGNWEVDGAWDKIAAILEDTSDKSLLLAAMDAVAAIRPTEAQPLLEPFTEARDEDIASAAWEALATLEGPPTGRISVHEDLLN